MFVQPIWHCYQRFVLVGQAAWLAVLVLASLAGCGQKGALYLPDDYARPAIRMPLDVGRQSGDASAPTGDASSPTGDASAGASVDTATGGSDSTTDNQSSR